MKKTKYVEIGEGYYHFEDGSFRITIDFIDEENRDIRELELILPKDSWYFDITQAKQLTPENKLAIKLDLERYAEKNKQRYETEWQKEKNKTATISAHDIL